MNGQYQYFALKAWVLLLMLASGTVGVYAQQFPVTVVTQVTRFSAQLEAYDDPGKVYITLLSTDARPEYQVLLRINLSGPGFNMRTRPDFLTMPITLRRNVPTILTGAQLREYFDPLNLVFGGQQLSRIQANGGLLPEGPMSLCVEVVDVNRFSDPPVSNTACANGLIRQQRPPLLLQPLGEVAEAFPQQLRFQWQPQHAGFVARYTLEVYEHNLPGMADNLVLEYTQPILQQTTQLPFYLMTGAAPLLQPGRRYLVRVRAEDVMGQHTFLNEGWSDVTAFTMLDESSEQAAECVAPAGLGYEVVGAGTLRLSWEAQADILGWELQTPLNGTVMLEAETGGYTDTGLEPETTYAYTLCVLCADSSRQCVKENVVLPVGVDTSDCGPELLAHTEALHNERLSVNWNAIPQAEGFTLSMQALMAPSPGVGNPLRNNRNRRLDEAPRPRRWEFPKGVSNFTVDSLVPGKTYQFELCKRCPDGSSQCSRWMTSFAGLQNDCLTEIDFVRTDSTDTSLTLSWTNMDGESSADDSFVLQWQLADRSQPADSVRLTYEEGSYTIIGLLPGRTYLLSACAECVAGNYVCLELPPIGGCAAAYTPDLAALLPTDALISWDISATETPLPLRMRYKAVASPHWQGAATAEVQVFDLDALGLLPSQVAELNELNPQLTYMAQLQTQCVDSLWSDWSEPVYFCGECYQHDSLRVSVLTDTSANILAVARANVEEYVFEYRRSGTDEWMLLPPQIQPLQALAGLQPATTYEVRQRYRCTRGPWSNYSPVLVFTTLPVCGLPTEVVAEVYGAHDAQLHWQPGQHAIGTRLRYRLVGSQRSRFSQAAWQRVNTELDREWLANLHGGATYRYQLRSECAENQSDWTEPENFVLDCAPPEKPICTAVSFSTAELTWEPNSPSTVAYQLDYRLSGDTSWATFSVEPAAMTLDSLDDLAWYEVRVATMCASGQKSVYSDSLQFRTPVRCEQPEGLALLEVGPFSGLVNWEVTGTISEWEVLLKDPTQPEAMSQPMNRPTLGLGNNEANPGPGNNPQQAPQQAPAQSDAETGSTGGQTYTSWQRYTVTEPQKLFQQLQPDTEYRVLVRGHCVENGWTEYSEEFSFRTLDDCRAPRVLGVEEVYQTTTRAVWEPANRFDDNYKVYVESVLPVSLDRTTQLQELGDNRNTAGRLGNTSLGMGIFRDSLEVTEPTALLRRLQPNTDYRYRVKTRCENYGWTDWSEWFVFHTDECAPVSEIVEEPLDRSTMRISWTPDYGENTYEFRYRLMQDGADWVTLTLTEPQVELRGLLSNSLYEYELAEVCRGGTGYARNPQDTFLMERPSLHNGLYVCGMNTAVDLSNQTPLAALNPGDTIVAFDFLIKVGEVSGGNGYFSGQGEIDMPYFNKAKFAFVFDNIYVNDEYRMVGGYLEATGFGVEVLPPWADALLSDIIEILEVVDEVLTEEQEETLEELINLGSTIPIPDSLQQQLNEALECLQTAVTEEEIAACQTQLANVVTAIENFIEEIQNGDFQVVFHSSEAQHYGFDARGEREPYDWYETRTLAGEEYVLPWKSAQRGFGEETVNATIAEPGTWEEVRFTQITDTPLPYTSDDANAEITFIGQDRENYYLVAEQVTEPDSLNHLAGLLNVVTYREIPLHVVLIPLSESAATDIDAAAIQADLEEVYKQALVKPNVRLAAPFSPPRYTPPLRAANSGPLANYTAQMRVIQRAWVDMHGEEEDTWYLFLTDDYEDTNRQGFMPRGRTYGYIYLGNAGSGQALSRVIAHELGHGAFVLEHTYEAHSDHLPENETDNLMDKGSGTRLYKWQWDLIHNPVNPPLLEGDAGGESVFVDEVPYEYSLGTTSGSNQLSGWVTLPRETGFLTPSGGEVVFGEAAKVVFGLRINDMVLTNGIVSRIELNGVRYVAIITHERGASNTGSTRYFRGYARESVFTSENPISAENSWLENTLIIEEHGGYLGLTLVSDQGGVDMYAMGDMVNTDLVPLDSCYCSFVFDSDSTTRSRVTGVVPRTYTHIPYFSGAVYATCPNNCDTEINNLAGVGRQLEQRLKPYVGESQQSELLALGEYFNTLLRGGTFAFYGDDLEALGPMVYLKPEVINYFKIHEIYTVETFDERFPHHSDFARDAYTIFVTTGNPELRATIPETYNENSVDHVRGGLYEYSFADLVKRQLHIANGSIFASAIGNYEDSGLGVPLSIYEAHEQYVAIFGTSSAMFGWCSYFFNVVSDVYDPFAVGYVVCRLGTAFKPGVSSGTRFRRLGDAVQKIKENPGLSLAQIADLNRLMDEIPASSVLKRVTNNFKQGETTFIRPSDDIPDRINLFSFRKGGDAGVSTEIGYIEKLPDGNFQLRVEAEYFNTSGFSNLPEGSENLIDNIGSSPNVKSTNGQFLTDVQLVKRDDGTISFVGRVDVIRTRLAPTNASEELIQWVSAMDNGEELADDLVAQGDDFIQAFNGNPEGMSGAWEVLPQSLRTNVDWLTRTSRWLDEGVEVVTDGDLVRLNHSGAEIGQIRNETLLVTKYREGFEGDAIGEAVNGCQVFKNGDDIYVKRVRDEAGLSEEQIDFLTASPKAHCLEKHGANVTDEALKFRTETGIAPNGELGNNPVNGTRFYSNSEIALCIDQLGPGTPVFNANLNQAGTRSIILKYDMGGGVSLGEGYRVGGSSIEGGIQKVTAIWWKDSTTGEWFLRTMFPVLE